LAPCFGRCVNIGILSVNVLQMLANYCLPIFFRRGGSPMSGCRRVGGASVAVDPYRERILGRRVQSGPHFISLANGHIVGKRRCLINHHSLKQGPLAWRLNSFEGGNSGSLPVLQELGVCGCVVTCPNPPEHKSPTLVIGEIFPSTSRNSACMRRAKQQRHTIPLCGEMGRALPHLHTHAICTSRLGESS